MVECKGPETTNETKERIKTRNELGLRMVGDSGQKERQREGEERKRLEVLGERGEWLRVIREKALTKEEVEIPILEALGGESNVSEVGSEAEQVQVTLLMLAGK